MSYRDRVVASLAGVDLSVRKPRTSSKLSYDELARLNYRSRAENNAAFLYLVFNGADVTGREIADRSYDRPVYDAVNGVFEPRNQRLMKRLRHPEEFCVMAPTSHGRLLWDTFGVWDRDAVHSRLLEVLADEYRRGDVNLNRAYSETENSLMERAGIDWDRFLIGPETKKAARIEAALQCLPSQEKGIVQLRYGLGRWKAGVKRCRRGYARSLDEIGKMRMEKEVSREWIFDILERSYRKLRHPAYGLRRIFIRAFPDEETAVRYFPFAHTVTRNLKG
ncbi:MAG: hypothetical protein HYW25_04350 [Candidatus Aenigmarchaeota archaeon]|nr:hypothetical protein [Candidatus Aenigmarchaeota archaeon]